MPYQNGFQQGYSAIGLDADGDLWFSAYGQIYSLQDDNDAGEFHVDTPLGVAEQNKIPGLIVYPNPGQNIIQLSAEVPLTEITMLDLLGKEVLHESGAINSSVDVSALQPGIYLIRIESSDEEFSTLKWLKK